MSRLVQNRVMGHKDLQSLSKYQLILARDQFRKNPPTHLKVRPFSVTEPGHFLGWLESVVQQSSASCSSLFDFTRPKAFSYCAHHAHIWKGGLPGSLFPLVGLLLLTFWNHCSECPTNSEKLNSEYVYSRVQSGALVNIIVSFRFILVKVPSLSLKPYVHFRDSLHKCVICSSTNVTLSQ